MASPPPTTWSSMRTPTRASASLSRWVSSSSARLGSGFPLGWLREKMTTAADTYYEADHADANGTLLAK